ncbi:LuxR C-terminal-related transcriptional regulator [Rhizorhabdus histidinilytica]|uniref:ATP-, maltotriose-and DNA-dependent transcriptional regulator MalT n=1 Tax=Rhizorhabdus histidinilytica TaxID=439228 RepID=A0A1T5FI10_9SPHN|nr:LuxR C-terminal-related transcriptional regulator [Rhizorhabdus histidinilytica]SKB95718.1 ATP-, maltotriose-and DNA-dependent transcriptional regulator MalT [Rhizorhabdus histidinilytica]
MRYCPPRLVEPLIARPRIARRMAEAAGKVTLIVGPPGSGKTSALASHHADLVAAGMAVRWLTLSAEDNDPAVLRRHLDHAFRGEGAEGREEGEGLSDPPGNIVGFIDGLEKIDAAPARDLIGAFVLELPPSSSFHITAHRMQGALFHDGWLRGVVEVIGPDELRMTDDEAALLLGEAWSPWDRQRINEAVDGWAAGLRFVGRAPRSADRLLDGAGERPFPVEMANYLDDVVCARMDPVALAALMEVSVLDRFTPEALAAMPGRPCDWAQIDDHIREGSFIRYVDEQRCWAAFHPVFGRHLRQRLRRFDPDRFDALNRFAASWFEANGFGAEAIRHAVTVADSAFAARVIENVGAIHVDLCDGPDVGLGERVPATRAGELPLLFLGQIYFAIRRGRSVEARAALEEAARLTRGFTLLDRGADPESIRGFAQLIDMVLDASDDRPITEQRLAELERAMEAHRGVRPILASGVACMLALAYLELSRYAEAATVCGIGLHAMHDVKDSRVSVFLRIHQADIAMARDTVDKAVLYIEDAQRIARIGSGVDNYEVIATRILRAGLHYENNELDAALALLDPSLRQLGSINAWVRLCASGFGTAAAIAGIRQGIDAAEAQLRAGEALARERNLPRLLQFMAIARLRELTRAGEWRAAMEHVESPGFAELLATDSLSHAVLGVQVPAMLEVARLMIELGRPHDAQAWLDRINKPFLGEADSRFRFTFRIMAMRAAYGMRRYNAAVDHMQAAVELASHAGLVRRALNNRQHLTEVFDWTIRNGRHLPARIGAYVDDVLRGADGTESGATLQQSSPRRGVEQAPNNFTLSPRETEIIALVAEGYITKEIAVRLGISEGTVKTHRKKIHEKLGAASRSQAIARARDLLII